MSKVATKKAPRKKPVKRKPTVTGYRDRIKGLRRVKASELVDHPGNWRRHPEHQETALKVVLSEVGWAGAVVVRELPNKKLQIIDGHLRKGVGGDEKVPVLVLDVTEEEANKLLVSLDPLAAMAETDSEKLTELLKGLEPQQHEFSELISTLADMENIDLGLEEEPLDAEPEFNRAAELQEQWQTATGQLWEITGKSGNVHRLLCGDSTKAEDVERLMGGETCDLCFTSPPYAQQRDYTKKIDDWDGLMQGVFGNIPANDKTQVLVNLGLIHRDGEWIPYWDGWIEWMRSQGWRRFGWYVWAKMEGRRGAENGRLPTEYEWIFHLCRAAVLPAKTEHCRQAGQDKGGSTRAVDGTVNRYAGVIPNVKTHGSIFTDTPAKDRPTELGDHPARMGIDLALSVIRCWHGNVYDPFLGSGTTLIAAENLGRRCFGMEIFPEYTAVCLQRASDIGMVPELIE